MARTNNPPLEGAKVSCPLCGSRDGRWLEEIPLTALDGEYRRQLGVSVVEEFAAGLSALQLYRCELCGLEYFDPLVAGSSGFYARLGGDRQYYSKTRWEFTETWRRLDENPDLIDVGCGDGFFLQSVKGTRRRGIEYNPDAARRAREAGLAVEECLVEDLPAESAEVVTLFQVLEHVTQPRDVLRSVERVLRPGGRLFVAVPNNDGWVGRAPCNPLNAPPHHPLRWRGQALRWVPRETGLILEELMEEPLAPEHLHPYRRARFLRWMAASLGGELPRYGAGSRSVWLRRMATVATEISLRCSRRLPGQPGTGHSIMAVYRKAPGGPGDRGAGNQPAS